MATFGELLKQQRQKLKLSLREFCRQHDFEPGNFSKLERGLFPPPQSAEKLEAYAKALKIERGSDAWLELFDQAAAEQGRIPDDLMANDAIVDKLPVLFKTIRSKKVTVKQLDKLIDKIKNI